MRRRRPNPKKTIRNGCVHEYEPASPTLHDLVAAPARADFGCSTGRCGDDSCPIDRLGTESSESTGRWECAGPPDDLSDLENAVH